MKTATETTDLTNIGQSGALLFGVLLCSIPGIIASFRKDPDQGKIWLFGLLGPLTIYITWVKALIWAVRPAGKSIEEYKAGRSQTKREAKAKERVSGGTGALKTTIENGDKVTGEVFMNERFGFGRIILYKNGYIYLSTRMSEPEKLMAISGNTDLALAQKEHIQLSGAILTVVTEKGAYTIGEGTYDKSSFFNPDKIKRLTRLVAAGNALIK